MDVETFSARRNNPSSFGRVRRRTDGQCLAPDPNVWRPVHEDIELAARCRRRVGPAATGPLRDRAPLAARREDSRVKAEVVVEPMTGIEPAYSAWEADVLP